MCADRVIQPDSGNRLVLSDDGGGPSLAIETNQDVNITNGDIIFGTAGKGIVLGATSNVDINTLDDYEEGTWTPLFNSTSGAFTTMTMDVIYSNYTKIGQLVEVQAYFRTDNVAVGTASGNLRVGGLPFTPVGGTAGMIGTASDWGGDYPDHCYVGEGDTNIYLMYQAASAGTYTNVNPADLTAGASSNKNKIWITVVYTV